MVELLVEKGANIFLKDEDGRTALHRAVINGHDEITKFFTLHYPDVASIADNKGKLPADYNGN